MDNYGYKNTPYADPQGQGYAPNQGGYHDDYGVPSYLQPDYQQPQQIVSSGQQYPQQYGQPQTYQQQGYGFGQPGANYGQPMGQTKFCKFCASAIPMDAVICTTCGRQVEEIRQAQPNYGYAPQPQVIINNNNNNNNNNNMNGGNVLMPGMKDKHIALLLCFFGGWLGAHKFYEGKILMGIIYLCTVGLFGFGELIDLILLLGKPRYYYPK